MDADHVGREPTIKDLAAMCADGDRCAGLDLIERLARMGVVATIDTLVLLVAPTARIGTAAFDAVADALDAARSLTAA